MPLIKNSVLMLVNGVGPLGLSLVRKEGSCLILLSPVLLEHLLSLLGSDRSTYLRSPTCTLSFLIIIQNVSILLLATCIGAKLCSVIPPEMKLSWQLTIDNTDVTRSYLRIQNYEQEKKCIPKQLKQEVIHVNIFPDASKTSQSRSFYYLAYIGCLNFAS